MDSRSAYLLEEILAELKKKPSDWQVLPLASGEEYKVLPGQVHEVYVLMTYSSVLQLNGEYFASHSGNWSRWFPCGGAAVWVIDKIDPVTGVITYGGGVPYVSPSISAGASEGWILTGGEVLAHSAGAWAVRWRRRFELER